jgi:non-specific serine/threonine protein kinase
VAVIYGMEREEDGTIFLILELVEGPSLKERLREARLPPSEILAIAAQTASALEAAHARGVIHRDLKPSNVLFTPDGLVKLVDFGISHRAGDEASEDRSLIRAGGILGTPGYLSPEQARGEIVDDRTDIFSFGCVLYECLTGHKAFGGVSSGERIGAVLSRDPDWSLLPADTPVSLGELLRACLHKHRSDRLTRIAEARFLLERSMAEGSGEWQPLYAGPRERRGSPTNLPRPISSFVGRTREREELELLLPQTRLLTLTGVGGCGKTRLALQLAQGQDRSFPGGIWWVDLARFSDPSALAASAASALGLPEQRGQGPLRLLVDYLRGDATLLLLDNCEHLVRAAGDLAATLLATCPDLTVLVTSREALGMVGEVTWRVPSLSLPPSNDAWPGPSFGGSGGDTPDGEGTGSGATADPGEASGGGSDGYGSDDCGSEAVQLFLVRARAALPTLAITPNRLCAIARLCTRLDGIPLAIELAAARVRVLSCEQIEARLDDRFHLLTGGAGAALERHQTLRAAMEWSYELLEPPERSFLRALGVFSGGWDLEAAATVVREDGDELAALDGISRLVEKSLAQAAEGPGGEARYYLLETVRSFALEELCREDEVEAVRGRHLAHYLDMAVRSRPALQSPGREAEAVLDRMAIEQGNFQAALAWCASVPGGVEAGLSLAAALGSYWLLRDEVTLARVAFAPVLAAAGGSAELRADALDSLARIVRNQDPTAAGALFAESLVLWSGPEATRRRARSLRGLARVRVIQGEPAAARAMAEESLQICREIADEGGEASTLRIMADGVTNEGRPSEGLALLEEALRIRERLGDHAEMAAILAQTGGIAVYATEDFRRGRASFEACLRLRRGLGDSHGVVKTLIQLGQMELERRAFGDARLFLRASLQVVADRSGTVTWPARFTLGKVSLHEADYPQARRILEQVLVSALRAELPRRVLASRRYLGAAAWMDGDLDDATRSFDEALRQARALGVSPDEAWLLMEQAAMLCVSGRPAEAVAPLREARRLVHDQDDPDATGHVLNALGPALGEAGHPGEARRVLLESLAVHRAFPRRRHQAEFFEALTALALVEDPGQAIRFWAAADALRVQAEQPRSPHEERLLGPVIGALSRAHGGEGRREGKRSREGEHQDLGSEPLAVRHLAWADAAAEAERWLRA